MILFKHSETETSHIYTLRSRNIYFLIFALALLAVLSPVFFQSAQERVVSLVIFWIVIIFLMVDTFKMGWRQYLAGFKGQTMHFSGNIWRGNWKMEIEK